VCLPVPQSLAELIHEITADAYDVGEQLSGSSTCSKTR
jgi:hypothetical protein